MKRLRKAALLFTTAVGLASTSSTAARAQATQSDAAAPKDAAPQAQSVADIIVTAQKRSESVQRVPIAITVVPAAQLERQQINTIADLRRTAPSLEFVPPGQSPGSGGFIRGLGTTLTSGSAEPSVGIVVDGVPQGNVPITNLFDAERVEVLRGPQGTLFGQSVSAGLINITTAAPRFDRFGGYAQVELANDGTAGSGVDRRIGRLVINAPLSSTAAVRIAGHFENIGGVTSNAARDVDSSVDTFGARARLLWRPTDHVTINLIGDYDKNHSREAPFFTVYETNNPGLIDVLAGCGITQGAGNNKTCSPVRSRANIETYGVSLQADIDIGQHTLTSITAYRAVDNETVASIDGLPTASFASPFPNINFGPSPKHQKLYSQEIRLSSPTGSQLEYVIGGYFSSQTMDYHSQGSVNLFFLPFPIPTDYTQNTLNRSIAAFGQATYRISDTIRLIGGARYTNNKVRAALADLTASPAIVNSNQSTVNNFSWKLGAQADVTPTLMAYATVARGFKGQTYDDTTNVDAKPTYIKPEVPTSVELGLKGKLLDNKIGFDLNVFHTNVQDYQAQICTPDLQRGIVCVPQNVRKVISKGVELGLFGQPLKGLSINGGVLYADARFPAGYLGTDGLNLGGKQLTLSSRWKATISGEYEHHLSDSLNGFFSADTVYRSRVRYVASGADEVTYKPHFMTGGRLGLRAADQQYEVAIFVRNLFDVHEPVLRYLSAIGAQAATSTTPAYTTYTQILSDSSFRTVGLSANVKF